MWVPVINAIDEVLGQEISALDSDESMDVSLVIRLLQLSEVILTNSSNVSGLYKSFDVRNILQKCIRKQRIHSLCSE